ncbi:MAG: RsmE family RNA methyltransferase [Candidatus Absconditabacteria bacterium]
MQIFITDDFQIKGDIMSLYDERVIYQLNKVLRAKEGYNFIIQNKQDNQVFRYEISLIEIDKKIITGKVALVDKNPIPDLSGGVVVSVLNNFSKMEMIVQKLSEIGVPKIIFWVSERSVIRDINQSKLERFYKISLEAVEQSNGLLIPEIIFLKEDAKEFFHDKNIVCMDFDGVDVGKIDKSIEKYFVIGPEGGLTSQDYSKFEDDKTQKVCIGKTVLRAETAAIVSGRILSNL